MLARGVEPLLGRVREALHRFDAWCETASAELEHRRETVGSSGSDQA